ncbi:hypothetical protein CYMTET_35845 [Cymbomonas tetramitiformis]|uniref:AMP-dependent synthetase/ligase domain-containing protein n=1 Tax=Cymbomonas tetramitiformis TaxID=36881 RepID=A0AAE0KNA6_9CHLO|nr:hypothetical protein CYMTET_35845 [Cymbomonas tetramitiformis]
MIGNRNTLHGAVAAQAASWPKRPAIYDGDVVFAFGALEAAAVNLARVILKTGAAVSGGEAPIGICGEGYRSVVAILAILKSGNAYVPLDPLYPTEQIQFMVQETRMKLILVVHNRLCDPKGVLGGHWFQGDMLLLESIWDSSLACSTATPTSSSSASSSSEVVSEVVSDVSDGSLAYVIYTSGSSGRARGTGVMGSHAAIMNRLQWMWLRFPWGPGEVACQKTSYNFLDSVWETFGALGALFRRVWEAFRALSGAPPAAGGEETFGAIAHSRPRVKHQRATQCFLAACRKPSGALGARSAVGKPGSLSALSRPILS